MAMEFAPTDEHARQCIRRKTGMERWTLTDTSPMNVSTGNEVGLRGSRGGFGGGVGHAHRPTALIAFTIAMMPARIAGARLGHD